MKFFIRSFLNVLGSLFKPSQKCTQPYKSYEYTRNRTIQFTINFTDRVNIQHTNIVVITNLLSYNQEYTRSRKKHLISNLFHW